ncbi:MAG: sigma-70 family RNA polymerase sigma factor [Alloprevotella sp.]|nr:sigma-70 family RNA polymerase sigma factor [Prevotellamassilia sp.]MDY2623052.1 sigma-70 family RNA polymerase sigma factor [Alloprevotella sp.]MDY4059843.1 sigma-70 family RNA polymerase sigma factor [Alloprevotella sp.]MDY5762748.1 sigma-70 family RNA polymerase sigma factor [Alloprevotella sp.]MDY6113895.1 sigma-70 family RNA polymerase sigma factor [Alloprevotella sp.]
MKPYSFHTDDELIAAYLKGDNLSFDALLERYKQKLFSYILSTVHREDLADDIFQDTFVKAIVCMRKGRYKMNGKFYSWLLCIAHNVIIDNFRYEQSVEGLNRSEINEHLYADNGLEGSPREIEMERENSLSQLNELIDQLPENQQEVLRMRVYENMSFKDIAEHTGTSVNTALGRMHYAVNNMKRMANDRRIIPYTL